ncbi:MAG TPA: hypothetical protein VFR44_12915 [Actinomycetota bacterium]|nr:hypothetical protein [Actinomycetota bacterium]
MRRTILLLAAIALMLAMVGTPAAAEPPVPATGVWSWVGGEWNQVDLPSGGARFTGTEFGHWTGTFVGTSAESYKGVIMPNGTLTALIRIEFTGSVDGAHGTLLMQTTVWAKSLVEPMTGRWVILGGSGDLANLRGQGAWIFESCDEDPPWRCYADYSGQVNIVP